MEKNRNIPFKNYILLAVTLILTVIVVVYFFVWHSNNEENNLKIPIMDKYLSYNFNHSYLILSIVIIDLIISTIITYKITNKKKYQNNIFAKYIQFKLSNLP